MSSATRFYILVQADRGASHPGASSQHEAHLAADERSKALLNPYLLVATVPVALRFLEALLGAAGSATGGP